MTTKGGKPVAQQGRSDTFAFATDLAIQPEQSATFASMPRNISRISIWE